MSEKQLALSSAMELFDIFDKFIIKLEKYRVDYRNCRETTRQQVILQIFNGLLNNAFEFRLPADSVDTKTRAIVNDSVNLFMHTLFLSQSQLHYGRNENNLITRLMPEIYHHPQMLAMDRRIAKLFGKQTRVSLTEHLLTGKVSECSMAFNRYLGSFLTIKSGATTRQNTNNSSRQIAQIREMLVHFSEIKKCIANTFNCDRIIIIEVETNKRAARSVARNYDYFSMIMSDQWVTKYFPIEPTETRLTIHNPPMEIDDEMAVEQLRYENE